MEEIKNPNPFKKLATAEEVPSQLKEKVMTSIHLAHLIGNVGELFTTKMGGTATKMLIGKDANFESDEQKDKEL